MRKQFKLPSICLSLVALECVPTGCGGTDASPTHVASNTAGSATTTTAGSTSMGSEPSSASGGNPSATAIGSTSMGSEPSSASGGNPSATAIGSTSMGSEPSSAAGGNPSTTAIGSTSVGGRPSAGGNGGASFGGRNLTTNSGGAPATTSRSATLDAALFTAAPHCPVSSHALHIAGTLDGSALLDDRDDMGINAGYSQGTNGKFDTPLPGSLALTSAQVELHFRWAQGVEFGGQAPITGGTMVPGAPHPLAGQTLCVVAGVLGFPLTGDEAGVFKFHITSVRRDADCSGQEVSVDLSGCMH